MLLVVVLHHSKRVKAFLANRECINNNKLGLMRKRRQTETANQQSDNAPKGKRSKWFLIVYLAIVGLLTIGLALSRGNSSGWELDDTDNFVSALLPASELAHTYETSIRAYWYVECSKQSRQLRTGLLFTVKGDGEAEVLREWGETEVWQVLYSVGIDNSFGGFWGAKARRNGVLMTPHQPHVVLGRLLEDRTLVVRASAVDKREPLLEVVFDLVDYADDIVPNISDCTGDLLNA